MAGCTMAETVAVAAVTFAQDAPSVAFGVLAEVAERVGATSKKLEKMAILSAWFGTLDDNDLALAARYLAGQVFPQHDARVLQVGSAATLAALVAVSGIDAAEIRTLGIRLGEYGEAARQLLPGHLAETSTLTLVDVERAVEELAGTGGSKAKTALLTALLRRAMPLEAVYLVKLVSGDLRIGLKQGTVEDALARGFGRPLARVSHAAMLLGDIGEVAVLARTDALDRAVLRLFHPLGAMLATPTASPEEALKDLPEGYALVEDKYDGVRAQVHKEGDHLAIYSRTLDDVTHRFPELHAALLALPGTFVLDGEIVGVEAGRALPFTRFQQRLGRKGVPDDLLRDIPAAFVAFDILYRDGVLLFAHPLTERRALLAALLGTDNHISTFAVPVPADGSDDPVDARVETGETVDDNTDVRLGEPGSVQLSPAWRVTDVAAVDVLFTAARARGNEGLMVKLPHSAYAPGRRGAEWRKVKRALATLDVVVTAVEWGHGRRHDLLSDYTFAVRASASDGTLLNVGKAFSGLTDVELAELTQWFRAHTRAEQGRTHTVDPEIILEVTFDSVQASTRHASGYALRFPRIVRLRDDKPVSEIDTIATVRALTGGAKEGSGHEEMETPMG